MGVLRLHQDRRIGLGVGSVIDHLQSLCLREMGDLKILMKLEIIF